MWIGCCQPPELFWMIQRSAVLRSTVKRKRVQSANCWLIAHWPLRRSNLNVRVTRIRSSLAAALSVGLGGVQIGAKGHSLPAARAVAIIWAGDKLASGAGGVPAIRESIRKSPSPAGRDFAPLA